MEGGSEYTEHTGSGEDSELYRISGSYSGFDEDSGIMECYAVSTA